MRLSIEKAASLASSLEEFQQILSEQFNIILNISRGRFSYIHPERAKPITGRSLGTQYERDHLLNQFTENMKHHDTKIFANIDPHLMLTLKQCAKALQNNAYARKVKLSNLKEMAKTVTYIQEHGYHTLDDLDEALAKAKGETSASRKELKATEHKLKELNEQIHYTGHYLAYKSIYSEFYKSKNKGEFQQKHSRELALYKTAVKFLKEKSSKERQPSMKLLKENKETQLALQKKQQERYQSCQNLYKELNTVHSSILTILGSSQAHPSQKWKQPDIIS